MYHKIRQNINWSKPRKVVWACKKNGDSASSCLLFFRTYSYVLMLGWEACKIAEKVPYPVFTNSRFSYTRS